MNLKLKAVVKSQNATLFHPLVLSIVSMATRRMRRVVIPASAKFLPVIPRCRAQCQNVLGHAKTGMLRMKMAAKLVTVCQIKGKIAGRTAQQSVVLITK
jgi:hypothetical protein